MSSKSKGSPTKRRHVSRSDSSQERENGETKMEDVIGTVKEESVIVSPKRRKVPDGESEQVKPEEEEHQQQHQQSQQQSQSQPRQPSIDEINAVISNLALPDPNIQVAIDHANHKTSNTEVQAYAKLAGPSWTYYVQTLRVVIGRSSEPNQQQQQQQQQSDSVQIDLGPAKVVSRRHASIQYNQDGRYWELTILGRNGVRIDKVSHKEGTTRLYSGNILDIGGVQMMFVLPDVDPTIAPSFYNKKTLKSQQQQQQQPLPPTQPQQQQLQQDYDQISAAAGLVSLSPGRNNKFEHKSDQQHQEFVVAQTLAGAAFANGQSNSYPRGVAMITRPQVRGVLQTSHYVDQDLSVDDAKDIKPPFSYATMITQAIMSSEEMMLSLSDIYEWIMSNYSFYRHSKSGWQNSIRHNLSLNKAFEKVPRKANESGKGMKWQINAQYKDEYMQKATVSKPGKMRLSPMSKQFQFAHLQHRTKELNESQYNMFQIQMPLQQSPTQSEQSPPQAQSSPPHQQQQHQQHQPPPPPPPPLAPQPLQLTNTTTLPPPIPSGSYQSLPPLVSPFPVLQPIQQDQQEDRKLQVGFMTPQKPPPIKRQQQYPDSLDGQYDQYGNNSNNANSNTNSTATTTGTSTSSNTTHFPSPSRSFLSGTTPGQISQLEAYTPERGSRGGAVNQVSSKPAIVNGNGNNSNTTTSDSTTNTNADISTSDTTTNKPPSNESTTGTTSSTTSSSGSNPPSTSEPNPNPTQPPLNPSSLSNLGQFMGMTPARQTSHLQLAPPSSAQQQQLPSSFMPGSSPAPFWKMTQFSSTPIRSSEFSPSKFSSPPVSSQVERRSDGSDDTIGDLQDIDLTRYGKKKQQLW